MDDHMEEKVVDTHITERLESLLGETVIIFTTSGGISGAGFTGVILKVNPCFVRILIKIGLPPTCPIGSGGREANNRRGFFQGPYRRKRDDDLGSIADIPINKIVSFVHHTVS